MSFEVMGLSDGILRALAGEGYTTPTPIQAKGIPPVLAGKDVLGIAQTGTGKTAAFALPIIHRLGQAGSRGEDAKHEVRSTKSEISDFKSEISDSDPQAAPSAPAYTGRYDGYETRRHAGAGAVAVNKGARKIRALVLSPTRELATQISESFAAYGRHTTLRHTVIFGGVGQDRQVKILRHGVDILVATPGRLLDLMQQGYVDLRHVQTFVLDEADQMLDMGFIHDIRRVVAKLPERRQSLMFSATMPEEIRRLADGILRDPEVVQVAASARPIEAIEQSVRYVEKGQKASELVRYLEANAATRVLVFTRTKRGADKVARHLEQSGFVARALHANKSQGQRQRAMAAFKSQQPPVLVATDIAARGLDIDQVSHVVNFDVPNIPETYVHRIGRTGRAGASGVAVSFCASDEREYLKAIEKLTGVRIGGSREEAGGSETGRREARPGGTPREGPGNNPRPAHPRGPKLSGGPGPRTLKQIAQRAATGNGNAGGNGASNGHGGSGNRYGNGPKPGVQRGGLRGGFRNGESTHGGPARSGTTGGGGHGPARPQSQGAAKPHAAPAHATKPHAAPAQGGKPHGGPRPSAFAGPNRGPTSKAPWARRGGPARGRAPHGRPGRKW